MEATDPKSIDNLTSTSESPSKLLHDAILRENTTGHSSTDLWAKLTSYSPPNLLQNMTSGSSTDLMGHLTASSPSNLQNMTSGSSTNLMANLTSVSPANLLHNMTAGSSTDLMGHLTASSPSNLQSMTTESPTERTDHLSTTNLTTDASQWLLDSLTRNSTEMPTKQPVAEPVPFYLNFRNEPWVIPLVAIVALNVLAIVIFEVYVLYKSCGKRRHLFVGQLLMFGIFLGSILSLAYIPEPHPLFCGITRVGVGVVYAVIFSTLLVKCLFLLKLHHGVYLNASTQAFFLFFVIAVEVTIVTQWLVYDPPSTISSSEVDGPPEVCRTSPLQRIEYLSYVMLLMVLVVVAAIRGRSLRENNRESLFVGIAIGISLVLWVAWMTVALVFDRRYEAPAEALGLACTCTAVFALIFVPKGARLSRYRRSGNGAGSSGSRSVLNTPSFLHLQPHAVIPAGGAHDTAVVKQGNGNADYCRGYPSRMWHYEYPSFQKVEPSVSDATSLKKSNSLNSRIY